MIFTLVRHTRVLGFVAALIVLAITVVYAQRKVTPVTDAPAFIKAAANAGLVYTYPDGFKEVKPVPYGDIRFNYALMLPDGEFEVWFKVTPLKQPWFTYAHMADVDKQNITNPDSAYINTGKAIATALSSDSTYFERQIQQQTLDTYHADEGKSYLVSLSDSPEIQHYNYALVISLQKNHVGNLLAVCLSNDKGPEFFQKINRLKDCLKFR